MHIDIYSDPICPWCFIGKRRLERALQARPAFRPVLRWRPFQLNPAMPAEGMERRAYLAMKFGRPDNAARIYRQIRQVGATEGIDFRFDRIPVTPNTIDAHRIIRLAARSADASVLNATLEGLMRAYFSDGRDIGDPATLEELAAESGLNPQAARALLGSDEDIAEVREQDLQARRAGIEGVPCYIINGRYALSGAQEAEAFYALFDMALQDAREAAAAQ